MTTHIVSLRVSVEVERLLQRNGRIGDEARNSQVVFGRRVRLKVSMNMPCYDRSAREPYHEGVKKNDISSITGKLHKCHQLSRTDPDYTHGRRTSTKSLQL